MASEIRHSTTRTAAAVLAHLGVFQARFRRTRGLRILCYHGVCSDADARQPWTPSYFVSATRFYEQMELLQRFGPVVHLPDCLGRTAGAVDIPEPCTAVTFDDVPACTVQHALPVLERLGIRASFFLATGHASSGELFPADVLHLIRNDPDLVSPGMRQALATLVDKPARYKQMPIAAVRTLLAEAELAVRRHADANIVNALRCLNWDEARTLAARGHEIGGHTVDHAILGREAESVRRVQVAGCFADIAREIGKPPIGFAYPNGGPGDFGESDRAILAEAGFTFALTTRPGPVERGVDRYALPRSSISKGHTLGIVALEVAGWLDARRTVQTGWSAARTPHTASPSGQPAGREPASMRSEEYAVLDGVLAECQPQRTLEIGMATGGSSLRICAFLESRGEGAHVAVDPYQFAPDGWSGQGVARVEQAGLGHRLTVIDKPDYIALPELVALGERYDFVLVDGWHSFDFTQLDLFYADLLLRPGGVLAIHDTNWPAVHRACRFLETHKPYERISPPISVNRRSPLLRAGRRISQVLRGPAAFRAARRRRTEWFALAAYRKRVDHQVPNDYYAPF